MLRLFLDFTEWLGFCVQFSHEVSPVVAQVSRHRKCGFDVGLKIVLGVLDDVDFFRVQILLPIVVWVSFLEDVDVSVCVSQHDEILIKRDARCKTLDRVVAEGRLVVFVDLKTEFFCLLKPLKNKTEVGPLFILELHAAHKVSQVGAQTSN